MKITDRQPVGWDRVSESYRQAARVKDKNDSRADTIQISPAGQLLREMAAVATGDAVRAERIEAIRARLEAGTYNIPLARVAEAILKELNLYTEESGR